VKVEGGGERTSAASSGSGAIDELVSAGRLRPDDAELLREELHAAERRGAVRAGAVLSWTTAGIAAVLWLLQIPAILFYMYHVKIVELFAEMNLGELPKSTELLLSIPGWVYAAVFLAVAIGLVVKEMVIRNRSLTLILNVSAIFAAIAYTSFVRWALFAPILDMMQKLGQEGGGGI
jgi:hypothetical protein